MATTTIRRRIEPPSTQRHRFVRGLSLATSGKEALKGELLAFGSSFWFLIFLLLPTLIVVFFGFAAVNYDLTISYNRFTTDHFVGALDPGGRVVALTIRTIGISIVTALGALALSFPVAYYLARISSEKNRGILVSLIVIPFWISFVVQVYALLPWVREDGYIVTAMKAVGLGGQAAALFGFMGYGTPNIVPLALIYIWLPFMILPLFTSLLRIDPVLLEAAQDLGAGKWRTFWNVTVPLAYPGIMTGTILVFITAFGSFVEPKLLGGKDGVMVGNYIYDAFLKFGALPLGAAASVIVLVPTIVLLYFYVSYGEGAGTEFARQTIFTRAFGYVRERLSSKRPGVTQGVTASVGQGDGHFPRATVQRGPVERTFDWLASRHGSTILSIFTILVLAAFYVPMGQVVIFSFNHDTNIINWSYPSLRWYLPSSGYQEVRSLFGDPDMMGALSNSIIIGLIVTGLSLAVGIPASMAVVRYRFRSKPFLDLMLYTGLVMPSIIMGVSILVFITFLNDLYLWPYFRFTWETGLSSIIVGHVTFCIPIVIVVLVVSLKEFDRSIEEAAMNLGADEFTTFARVTLPNIMPGIVAAALLSFTFSFSEVVVTIFLKGQGVETLPVIFWATLSKKIPSPELNAASTLILAMSIIFVFIANRIQKGGTMFRF